MSRRQVAWAAGTTAVLASVNSALINELHGGWPWWAGAAAGTALAAWLAVHLAAAPSPAEAAAIKVDVNNGAVGSFHAPVTFDQRIDLSQAKGVQIGDRNTQHNTFE